MKENKSVINNKISTFGKREGKFHASEATIRESAGTLPLCSFGFRFFPQAFRFDFFGQSSAQFVSAVHKIVTRIYSL